MSPGDTVELLEFDFAPAIPLLLSTCKSLYKWQGPHLPDDLSVYRPNGSVCLLSCGHERFSELFLTQDELRKLRESWPSVPLRRLEPREGEAEFVL